MEILALIFSIMFWGVLGFTQIKTTNNKAVARLQARISRWRSSDAAKEAERVPGGVMASD